MESMLKEFCIDYVDANGCRRSKQVVAFDASQAMHVLKYVHPEASVLGLSNGVPLRTVLASEARRDAATPRIRKEW